MIPTSAGSLSEREVMAWGDDRWLEQRRLDRQREEQRVRREQETAARERQQAEQKARDHAAQRAADAKSQAKLDAILNSPSSYLTGHVPDRPDGSSSSAVGASPAASSRPEVTYPTSEWRVTPFEYRRHPGIHALGVEGLPDGRIGIDWQNRFGRELVTAEELGRGWRVYRRGGTSFPLELRATGGQVSVRWLAPGGRESGAVDADQSIGALAGQAAASVLKTGFTAWRKRRT